MFNVHRGLPPPPQRPTQTLPPCVKHSQLLGSPSPVPSLFYSTQQAQTHPPWRQPQPTVLHYFFHSEPHASRPSVQPHIFPLLQQAGSRPPGVSPNVLYMLFPQSFSRKRSFKPLLPGRSPNWQSSPGSPSITTSRSSHRPITPPSKSRTSPPANQGPDAAPAAGEQDRHPDGIPSNLVPMIAPGPWVLPVHLLSGHIHLESSSPVCTTRCAMWSTAHETRETSQLAGGTINRL